MANRNVMKPKEPMTVKKLMKIKESKDLNEHIEFKKIVEIMEPKRFNEHSEL